MLSKHAICFCDDDNDLEMALACHHAFVPGVSSDSMAAVIQANPTQITATGGPGTDLEGTDRNGKGIGTCTPEYNKYLVFIIHY